MSRDQHGSPAQNPSACQHVLATEIGICSLDIDHVVQAEHPGAAVECSPQCAPAGGRARMASATSRNMFDGRFGITF